MIEIRQENQEKIHIQPGGHFEVRTKDGDLIALLLSKSGGDGFWYVTNYTWDEYKNADNETRKDIEVSTVLHEAGSVVAIGDITIISL